MIDGDGHWLEPVPVFLDYLRDIGGPAAVDKFFAARDERSEHWYRMSPTERNSTRKTRPTWWGFPGDTLDRATVMMPSLLNERLGEFGIDYALVYPTLGLLSSTIADTDLRRAFIRALNTMSSEMFADFADRMTPAAVVPTWTPEEAIDEAEYVVRELNLKVALINGTLRRPIPAQPDGDNDTSSRPYFIDTLVHDPIYDYDPVWQKFVDLKLAVTTHSGSIGWVDRTSPTSFVFNHLGHFAQSNHTFARALFLAGVTRRFPTLRFAFLEGGVGWACNLLSDLVGHWEKRSREAMLRNLRPTNLDLDRLRELVASHGGKWLEGRTDEVLANLDCFYPGLDLQTLTDREEPVDDFGPAKIESKADISRLFADNFFFGCEADDPITAFAFDRRLGLGLKPVFSSDVAHFDVVDMSEVLEEAYELIEDDLLTAEDFRAFTFGNAVELHGSLNPDFFSGTVVEQAAKAELTARQDKTGSTARSGAKS